MRTRIEYQTIMEKGQAKYAVVPMEAFRVLLSKAGAAEATIPHEVVSAVVDGMTPARAWRKYLGLSQADVAKRMGISQPAYAQMEAKGVKVRRATRDGIASVLGLVPEQLEL
ncbi:MAG: helix-turn-helix transcriptional regulator [Gammaproteobacteria bacterium]|nr:helix-turn-helix transcriptional regulator [Gammaproteobacteria bacterium]